MGSSVSPNLQLRNSMVKLRNCPMLHEAIMLGFKSRPLDLWPLLVSPVLVVSAKRDDKHHHLPNYREVCFYYISPVLIAFNLHKNLEVQTITDPVL